jgi:site-specific recombinase XerD
LERRAAHMEVETPDLMGIFRDRLGRRPSPIVMPGYRAGQAPGNKGLIREPDPFTDDEVIAMVKETSRRGYGGWRDRALIIVLWRCGLRISEALNLRVRDLDLEHGFMKVRYGKGHKSRVVVVDPDTVEVLRDWFRRREQVPGMAANGFVFCTISQPAPGGRMGAPQFRTKLKLLAERAGLDRDPNEIYPHQLRHTTATNLANEGKPISAIKEQLGHEHLSTTEGYIKRVAPVHLHRVLSDRPVLEL